MPASADGLGDAALALIVFGLVWWLAAAPLSVGYRLVRGPLQRLPARTRSWLLLCFSALPMVTAAMVALLVFTPAMGHWLVSAHCHDGLGCDAHVPSVGGTVPTLALAVAALLMIGAAGLRLADLLRGHQRRLRQLTQLAEPVPEAGYARITCEPPFALTAGLWRPHIYLSTGLERRLSADTLAAVIAHERAHARRRDTLRLTLASAWAPALLSGTQQPLLKDLRRASEQCCDAEAAAAVGDQLCVADALLLAQRALSPRSSADPDGDLPARIAELMAAPPERSLLSPALVISAATVVSVVALFGVNAMHHGTELMLALLDR